MKEATSLSDTGLFFCNMIMIVVPVQWDFCKKWWEKLIYSKDLLLAREYLQHFIHSDSVKSYNNPLRYELPCADFIDRETETERSKLSQAQELCAGYCNAYLPYR